jgi:UDP-N-acetylmuramyl tripeptide synthase
MGLRVAAAVCAGKIAAAASRIARRGGGTAIAGLVALRVDPNVVRNLAAQAAAGAIVVTGTNGKTTTSLMLSGIAGAAGLQPLHNRSGSNLMRGVAAMLVDESTFSGHVARAAARLAILEVDEATLPAVVGELEPRAVVFTNLFRDQLDRYGEVDTVAKSWERALASVPTSTVIALNADDPAVAHLGRSARCRVLYYGVEDASVAVAGDEHASDFRTCLDCGAELAYDLTFYGHLGHWRCSACSNARPTPQVRLTSVALDPDATALTAELPDGVALRVRLPLAGVYNAYNALAAATGAIALDLPREAVTSALEGFAAAFGRQERFQLDGRDVSVLLGKNPTGLNQVLRTLAAKPGDKRLLFFLNDGIADGRDVSWIWDTDYETLHRQSVWVLAAGTRCEDLALRLKYAGFGDDVAIEHDARTALARALDATPPGGELYVIPTYTAMLEVRELLAGKGGARHFWERG